MKGQAMKVRGSAALAASVLAFAGCGGSDSGESGAKGSYATAADLASAFGCTGYTGGSEELFVKEGGPCKVGVDEFTVYTFNDNAARDQWLEAAKIAGGVHVKGDKWVVTVPSSEAAKTVTDRAGGEAA